MKFWQAVLTAQFAAAFTEVWRLRTPFYVDFILTAYVMVAFAAFWRSAIWLDRHVWPVLFGRSSTP